MRLLLVTRELPPRDGPAATWSFEMARRLARRCEDLAVLGIGVGASEPASQGAFELIAVRGSSPGLAELAARDLAALRRRRFDVVLGADWVSGTLGLVWRGRSGVRRAFAVVHDAELDRHSGRGALPIGSLYRRSRELLLARFDAVLTPGARAHALLDGLHGARALAIGRGCDPERFRPMPRNALAREHGLLDRRVLASAGPLIRERCIDRLLFAVSALGVRYPDLCCVIAGEGPERQPLELLAERLRIAHRVRFLGPIPAATWPEIHNLCDVFVHLTAGGERPVDTGADALLQARASGKPLVVTAAAACEEGIDARTAMIVPEDDSTALAEGLTSLLDDPEGARALGARGRQRVLASATWDVAAERVLQVMTGSRRSRARASDGVRQQLPRADAAPGER